jgi:cytochrome c-type biogenesis protein CcmE
MKAGTKFLIGSAIIVITLASLAWVGFTQSKTYYHTISELSTLPASALHQRMRVAGTVQPGSISRLSNEVNFVLVEQGRELAVSYVGRDPLPDTFKDNAQALAEGHLDSSGHFVAEQIQSKCASKYQSAPGQPSGSMPATGRS